MEENRKEGQPSSPQELLKRLGENKRSLHIARVPPKTQEAFQKLAEEEFCGDYGMALKWLLDGILTQDTELIIAKLEEHEARIINLENRLAPKIEEKADEHKPVVKHMLNGQDVVVKK